MVGIDAEKRSFPSALLQWSRSVIEEGATKLQLCVGTWEYLLDALARLCGTRECI